VSWRGNQLTGEVEYAHLRGDDGSRQVGFYVQDALPIFRDFYGVLRIESFSPRRGSTITGELIGLFWRPLPYLLIKADYQFADGRTANDEQSDNVERGFLASIALFF